MKINRRPTAGIDDMACYIPGLYLDLRTLAAQRNIPYEKLADGLGLLKMALPDADEDAATMAAEAIGALIRRNQLDPKKIGRIYLGTESALDMAKPTASYALNILEQQLEPQFGPRCLRHCDVVDMTFACIGAVDALQMMLDWVERNPENLGIVVASDVAKYEMGSGGEYTQGAGAVALLLKSQPRLLAIRNLFGVATESVHDFFKPRREKFSETPVFDGHFSNRCYQWRMHEALDDFRVRAISAGLFRDDQYRALSDRWSRMIFHLPYAYHAKRMFPERFVREQKQAGKWTALAQKYALEEPPAADNPDLNEKAWQVFLKKVSESAPYRQFVDTKLEKAQRAGRETGNLYTASIFLALMSSFESDWMAATALVGKRIGFVAYGSGSKAKVFEGIVQEGWAEIAARFDLFKRIATRRAIHFDEYERLHRLEQQTPIGNEIGVYRLQFIEKEGATPGARHYAKRV